MKTITLSYPTYRTVTIDITKLPLKYREWLDTVFTDDKDRTDEQWHFAEENNFYPEIIKEATGDTIHPWTDVDIEDYEV